MELEVKKGVRKGAVYRTRLKGAARESKNGAWLYLSSSATRHLEVSKGDVVEVWLELDSRDEPVVVVRRVSD